MVENFSYSTTNVAVAPTACLPSIKQLITGASTRRGVSLLQELGKCVDYLRFLYNPEVRGSRRKRAKASGQEPTTEVRPRSRDRQREGQMEDMNVATITPADESGNTLASIDTIRANAFERVHSIRWLTSLIVHADDIFLRVVVHHDAESDDLSPGENHEDSGDSSVPGEIKEEGEVIAMHEKLIGEAAALLAACAGTAGSGRVSRTYAFDLPSVDAPSGYCDAHFGEGEGEGRRGTSTVSFTLTDAPLENGDYASVGAQTWGAACVMADMIFENPARFFGSESGWFPFSQQERKRPYRVLELGAGTGLVGLSIAKLLEHCRVERVEVVLTDVHPSVLTNLRSNVSANFPESSNKSQVDVFVRFLDWSSYAHGNASSEGDSVDLGTFDLIVGADIIYEKEHALWIRKCLERLLRPPSRLCQQNQNQDEDRDREAYFHLVIPLRRTHVLESRTVEQVFGNKIDQNKFKIVHQERFSSDPYYSCVDSDRTRRTEPMDEVEYAHIKIGWKKTG